MDRLLIVDCGVKKGMKNQKEFELRRRAEEKLKEAAADNQDLCGAPVKQIASVADIIKETAEFSLRGSNVRCEYTIAGDLWTAEIDIGQMSQVIQNIIINANQAMPCRRAGQFRSPQRT
ncbi:MAG: hypothetical protein Q8P24_21150 [Desulfobacterales bacterium]|nr:hypothetical protein [Desulfobacterales bacterium]